MFRYVCVRVYVSLCVLGYMLQCLCVRVYVSLCVLGCVCVRVHVC